MYPGVYQAYYQYKPQFCQPVGHANVFIAAAVTAGARTVLHQRLLKIQAHKLTDHLGDCYPRILYCDTDSVIFMWPNDAEELTSVGLGHWTDEYPDTPIASFFALAPKVYALLFETGKQATKAKGVQLTLANQTKLSMEAISPLLQECARTGCLMTGPIVPKKIQLDNFNIYSNSTSRVQGYATMFSRYNYKDMRIIITKRKIHEDTQFEVGVSSMLYTEPLRE
jgi:DNA polymerase elongation subunit (family B)